MDGPLSISTEKYRKYSGNKNSPWVWVFLFLAVRLALLKAFSPDIFWYEELFSGTAAKEILAGSNIPLWEWQKFPHEGGTLWTALLAIPFFKILGPSYFALKLVPITLELFALILAYGFLSRHFSKRSADIAACLIIFGAPAWIKLRMLAVGTHASADFLILAALWSFYEAAFASQDHRRGILFALAGIFSGLGLGYAYITVLSTIALILCGMIWKLLKRNFLYFLGGFLAGYGPTIFYNASHHGAGFVWLAEWVSPPYGLEWSGYFSRLIISALQSFIFSFSFGRISGLSSIVWTIPYGGLITLAFGLACQKNFLSKKIFFFLIYPALFILVYAASPWYWPGLNKSFFDFRYQAPFQLMLILGASIGFAGISRDWIRRGLVGCVFLLSGIGLFSMRGNAERKDPSAVPGYSYNLLGSVWAVFHAPFPEGYSRLSRFVQGWDADRAAQVYDGYFDIGNMRALDEAFLRQEIKKQPVNLKHFFLCRLLGQKIFYEKRLGGKSFAAAAQSLTKKEKSHFYAGAFGNIGLLNSSVIPQSEIGEEDTAKDWFAFSLGYSFYGNGEWADVQNLLAPSQKAWAYRGVGKVCAEYWTSNNGTSLENSCMVSPADVPESFKSDFFWGLGWGTASYSPAAYDVSQIELLLKRKKVKQEFIERVLEGFRTYRQWQKGLIDHPV